MKRCEHHYDKKTIYTKLNAGGEGEEFGCVQVNNLSVLQAGDNFTASRDGNLKGLGVITKAGPLVICDPQHLPFRSGVFETIYANGVPIDIVTFLGPGYSSEEICRVCYFHTAQPCTVCRHGIIMCNIEFE